MNIYCLHDYLGIMVCAIFNLLLSTSTHFFEFKPRTNKVKMNSVNDNMENMPPGTELMRSTTDHQMIEAHKHVILPMPSNDPSDPLNWNLKWKTITIVIQSIFVLFLQFPTLAIAPLSPVLQAQFGVDNATTSLFLGVTVITLGWANLVLIPCSNLYGRRSVCLATVLLVIASNIWQALATGKNSFFGARALGGFASAVTEAITVQTIVDVFFLHERGMYMGIYFTMYFTGAFIGPIIAGNMAQYVGWRNFFWLCTATSILIFLLLLFLFPETKFHRTGAGKIGMSQHISSSQITKVVETQYESAIDEESKAGEEKDSVESRNTIQNVVLGKGKPVRSQWNVYQKPIPGYLSSVVLDAITPLLLVSFPIVIWTACVVCFASNTILVMNLTLSPIFFAPPYLFTPGKVGFVNFAFFAGGIFSVVTAGPCSDWLVKKLTRRNHDLREPEMRLLALIPYFAIMVLGCIICGLGYRYGWPWEAIVILGYTCIGLQCVALPTLAVAYAVDCYKPISGEILVICTIFKNTFGFGMSWWVPELTPEQSVFVLFAFNTAICLCGIPLYFFGKRLRHFTRKSKVHAMEVIL